MSKTETAWFVGMLVCGILCFFKMIEIIPPLGLEGEIIYRGVAGVLILVGTAKCLATKW